MLSRAKQCNVLWSHVEQQGPAAGDPSSSARPRSPPRAGVLATRYEFDERKALCARCEGRYFLSLAPAFFFFFDYSEPADGGCCSVGG